MRFRHEGGVYADLDAGGMLIGILSQGAAKALSFPVELTDSQVHTAGSVEPGPVLPQYCAICLCATCVLLSLLSCWRVCDSGRAAGSGPIPGTTQIDKNESAVSCLL